MQFSPESILLALFTGVVAGLASYFAYYTKVKAEVRAATEDLRQTIQNLVETTRAVEMEKARVASDAALASDWRKFVYALAVAAQSLVHSIDVLVIVGCQEPGNCASRYVEAVRHRGS